MDPDNNPPKGGLGKKKKNAQHAAIGEQSQQQLPINPDHQQKSVQTGQHSKNKQKQLLKENPQEQLSSVKPSTSSQKQEQSGPKQQHPPKGKKNKKQQSKEQNQPETTAKSHSSKPQTTENQRQQSVEQIIQIFKSKLCIPKRKIQNKGGTLGRLTEIDVNHLPLNIDKLFSKTVYHMDVEFKPELPKRLLRNALEEFNRQHYPKVHFAFDGRKNMYTVKELKGKSGVVSVLNEENNKTIDYTITTSNVNTINMNKIQDYLKTGSSNNPPGDALQALDIVLKNRPFSLRFTNVGRSFFPVPRIIPADLGNGMELWKGFFQSPIMGWKPYLNIDVAHKGFPKHQSLLDYIKNELTADPKQPLDQRALNTLESYVKGLKVDFQIPNQPNTKRSFKVVNLLDTAANFFFEMETNNMKKKVNVVQYFKSVRNYTILYPNLPCLHVGNIAKKTAIPMELCVIQKGQVRLKKLSDTQTAAMVKHAARPPQERRTTIENCIHDIKYNQDPVLKEFGVEVVEKFASVPARVLDQPSLAYGQNKEVKPRGGVWKAEKFASPIKLENWIVLNMDSRTNPQSIKNFEKMLSDCGKNLNVTVSKMKPILNYIIPRGCRFPDIGKQVTNLFNSQKNLVDLIVVVIPDFPSGLYAIVKQCSELQVGVLTQCIKSKTMFKMNPSTAGNILLKINSKLNGVNHTLAIRSSPPIINEAIIFGADVTHPSPEQTNIPSIAAVSASHDLYGSQYNMEFRFQDPKMEVIEELEHIVHNQLLKYREKTGVVPKKILYFRDGVSEGQFMQLLNIELVAIRRACLRLGIGYQPGITFIVVQKRHHTRMFPKFNIDMDGKFMNVFSGTIVDTHITHPTELDFYLCSHASIQGTARPTKYHLLWDDNNINENELEQITFYLCFMFSRCTRSVSYPAPTYYAHLAAFRARAYIENKSLNLLRLDDEQVKNKLNLDFVKNTPMFFV